ncbi:Vps62-related protein [Parasedimentitalea marina]|nr:Vps62-related protein [Parasedimentitalea marina]
MMKPFIGKVVNLPANGGTWSVDIARRNGHGCDGENAVLFARAKSDGPSTDAVAFSDRERTFHISGDGGMWVDTKRTGLPGFFKQTGSGQTFQWVLTEPLAPLSADVMTDLLRKYAPTVYLAKGEDYNPSSVDWAFPYLVRVRRGDKYWLYTKQELDSPTDGDLEVFKGQGANATVYGFVVRKAAVYDLVYFTYYPYNRGKHIKLLNDSVFGNHVGDWENVVVRLDQNLNPTAVYLSQHDKGEMVAWADIPKSADTHPIVYAAAGSHGYYSSPGNHQYHSNPPLVDETSVGTVWDTQTNLVGFNFNAKQGVAGSNWPEWMNVSQPLSNSSPINTAPGAGPIYRWGNGENGCGGVLKIYQDAAGACRLEDGPTGPIDKLERWDVSAQCLPGKQISTLYQSAVCD